MTAVPTARGDTIDSSELGLTMMHEHVFTISPEVNQNYPETWGDEDVRVQDAISELDEAKGHGIDTIVDVTVLGLGRNIARIKRIAQSAKVNIIVATGLYTMDTLPIFFSVRGPGARQGGPEFMTDWFVKDIQEGIADTGVRAAVLKCATALQGLTPGVERVLRAVAQAHRRTGVPICTHTSAIPNAIDQQRVFVEEGVDLRRVYISHIESAAKDDLPYVEKVIANGSFISFDTFGIERLISDQVRMDCIAELCQRGHADRIVLGNDHQVYCDYAPVTTTYSRVVDRTVPGLRERGVSDDQIHQMLFVNPRRVFETTSFGSY
jgi:phosphotriesterase-related protein